MRLLQTTTQYNHGGSIPRRGYSKIIIKNEEGASPNTDRLKSSPKKRGGSILRCGSSNPTTQYNRGGSIPRRGYSKIITKKRGGSILVWPKSDLSIPDIMRDLKKFTSIRIIRQAEVEGRRDLLTAFEAAGQETGRSQNKVWQDSYWEKEIFTERFLRQKLNYIHRNPIRAGMMDDPSEYPYSSYRNYVDEDDSLIEIDRDWMGF